MHRTGTGKHLRALVVLVSGLTVVLACGAKPPAELIVGTWETEMMGERMSVEFRSDGTVQAEGEEVQGWKLIEGDPHTVQILDMDDGDVDLELSLTIQSNDEITLSGEGRTLTLTRVE